MKSIMHFQLHAVGQTIYLHESGEFCLTVLLLQVWVSTVPVK